MSFDLPELPMDWIYTPLAMCCRENSVTYGVVQPGMALKGGIPLIRVTNFQSTRLELSDVMYIAPEIEEKYGRTRLEGGEVLLTIVGSVGQVAVVPNRLAGFNVARAVAVIHPLADIDPAWIALCLRSPLSQHLLGSRANTTVQTTINLKDLRALPVPMPPRSERHAITEFVGILDERIALLRETNATLEAIAQALFKSWFVDFGPVHAKQAGRVPDGMDEATAALFPDSFEEAGPGGRPKGWGSCAVYDMATYINGAAYKAFEPNSEGRGLPIIKIAELKVGVTGQTAFSDVVMPEKYRILTGDILFSWSGNPDTSIDTFVWPHEPAWLNQHIFRVIPRVPSERAFLLRTLKHMRPVFAELARNKQTTGLGHVTVGDLKRLQIVKPPQAALEYFDRVIAPMHGKILDNDQRVQTITTLRDTLLPRLICGQLRLPDGLAAVKEAA